MSTPGDSQKLNRLYTDIKRIADNPPECEDELSQVVVKGVCIMLNNLLIGLAHIGSKLKDRHEIDR